MDLSLPVGNHPCPVSPLALPSAPSESCPRPTWLASQSLGFSAETLQVVVTPLLVLLQGALLFVAAAAVVTLVGLAHRGRGDCGAERKETALKSSLPVSWLSKIIQEQKCSGLRRRGCGSVEFFHLSSPPQLRLRAWTDDQTLEQRHTERPWEERGNREHVVGH